MSVPLLAGLVVVPIAIFLWLGWRRSKLLPTDIRRRSVACKRCGAQIAVNNVKLEQEFSLRCDGCGSRSFYKQADLHVR
jgi:DNA-directed RNA polymerase subunit RPC12/RpoP